jgi:hypothetical protein
VAGSGLTVSVPAVGRRSSRCTAYDRQGVTVTSPPGGPTGPVPSVTRALDRLDNDRVAWLLLVGAMALFVALALWWTRGTTLFVDEVDIFFVSRGLHPSALLAPLNGHLVLIERLVYAVDFKLFGASFVMPRLVQVGGVVLTTCLLFVLLKRRIGPAAALAPVLLILFLGSAWELNLVVSGIGNVYAVAGGLGALLALERRDRVGDVLACLLLIVSVSSFTLGVAFAVGITVLIALQRTPRRLWVSLVPLALYAAWLVWLRAVYVPAHGDVQHIRFWNILLIPNFIADEAASTAGAVAGLNYDFEPGNVFKVFSGESAYGPVLAALAAWALVRRLRRGNVSVDLWAFIAILLAFWVALALGFGLGRTPTTVRYVYGGAFVFALIAAEAVRGVRLSQAALLALFAITLLALGANLARLREGAHYFRNFATSLRGQLTGIELARGHVSPSFVPGNGPANFDLVVAGKYLAAVDRVGSPAFSESALARQPENVRHSTDSVLAEALGVKLVPAKLGDGCRRLPGGSSIPVSPPGITIAAPNGGQVALRKFASGATVTVGSLQPGRPAALVIPPDRSARPWQVSVTPASASATVCGPG